jgi:Ni,Fe-hydrogenase maturation factor
MKILVFGNPHLKDDALAVEIANELVIDGVEWQITDTLNDVLEPNFNAILDVAKGIPKVVLLDDIDKLKEHNLVSLHDYDLNFFLKLHKAMGNLDKVNIIAIPLGYDKEKAIDEIKDILTILS